MAAAGLRDATGERLVFVGGCPRSGTTLIQNVLDSHPDVAGGPEFDRAPEIARLYGGLRASHEAGRIDAFGPLDDMRQATARYVEDLLLPFADQRNCQILSEKTPANALVMPTLMKLLPQARFILVVRHPAGTMASMRQVARRAEWKGISIPFLRSTAAQIATIGRYLDASKVLLEDPSDRLCVVRFEDFVTEPLQLSGHLCQFLDIADEPAMAEPARQKHAGESALDDIWYGRDSYYRDPEADAATRWVDELPERLGHLLNYFFGDHVVVRSMGYDMASYAGRGQPRLALDVTGLRVRGLLGAAARRAINWKGDP